jgi:hypothetical protein
MVILPLHNTQIPKKKRNHEHGACNKKELMQIFCHHPDGIGIGIGKKMIRVNGY